MANGNPADAPQKQTRYQRVKQILNTAQGDTHPSYQGHNRFWELPLDELLNVTLYGIPMIAPIGSADVCADTLAAAATTSSGLCNHCACSDSSSVSDSTAAGSCGCSGATAQANTPHTRGRGAASGLIKGLKGEFPFNGTQFPPLMWGGQRVSSSDILFIEAWIDDGCPATDEATTAPGQLHVSASHSFKMALAQGFEAHQLSSRSINEFRSDAGQIKVRKNIEYLTPTELERFRHAVQVMQCFDTYAAYDDRSFLYWANIHANNCQHGWEQFLSWHRAYLYMFEQKLQDIDPSVTLPYWDWPMYRDDVIASINDQSSSTAVDNGVVPVAYQCWVDDAMLQRLKGAIPDDLWLKLKSVEGQTFSSGNRLYIKANITFTSTTTDDLIFRELQRTNPLWNRNRWPGGDQSIIFEAYPTPDDIERLLQVTSFFDFGSGPTNNHFYGALENIHNLVHNFSGGANPNFGKGFANEPQYGDMISAGTTARDPIFWGHHSNVDRLWAEWQKRHPNVEPDDSTDILAPWSMDVQDTLNTSKLGYEYLQSSHLFETDNTIPIARFKSAKIPVAPSVLATHRHAEIRLHKVQYSTAGGAFVRIFLNEPDATTTTPMRGNDHFVAQIATFSGECIGGPGHCNVPPATRRKFDLRPRHRKTPANFHVDVTDTIKALRAKGEQDFHINLVVLDIDGQPKPNALWLDAVSLNFKD